MNSQTIKTIEHWGDKIQELEENEEAAKRQFTQPNDEQPKKIVKRPFLTRGSGKAGGIGNGTARVKTPPKKKSKSSNPTQRARAGGPDNCQELDKRDYSGVGVKIDTYGTERAKSVEMYEKYKNKHNLKAGGLDIETTAPLTLLKVQNDFAHLPLPEQLEKQVHRYNLEISKVNQQRQEFEKMLQMLKQEQKELELRKKRDKEEIDKMRDEHMLKIKKDRKVLDQRLKNMQYSTATRGRNASFNDFRDREEIEELKKQLKEQAVEIDRLKQENHDVIQENNDLREELQAQYEELKCLRQEQYDQLEKQERMHTVEDVESDVCRNETDIKDNSQNYFKAINNDQNQQVQNMQDSCKNFESTTGIGKGTRNMGVSANSLSSSVNSSMALANAAPTSGIGRGISKNRKVSTMSCISQVEEINNQLQKQMASFANSSINFTKNLNSSNNGGNLYQSCQSGKEQITVDDNEEFQNIENQINEQIEHSKIQNQSQNARRRQRSIRYGSNSQMPNLIGQGLGNLPSSQQIQNENEQFEQIEEQIREESPTKSEKNRDEVRLTENLKDKRNVNEVESEQYELELPFQYHNDNYENVTVKNEVKGTDGKLHRIYLNGKKEVIFSNGVRRETFTDGYTIVYFNNGDIKQTNSDQKIVYYFQEAQTTQTTFSCGLQVFKFKNNQIEKHHRDGKKEIIFPDGTIKCIYPTGDEESIFTDGTKQKISSDGTKTIIYANGHKDVIYADGSREQRVQGTAHSHQASQRNNQSTHQVINDKQRRVDTRDRRN